MKPDESTNPAADEYRLPRELEVALRGAFAPDHAEREELDARLGPHVRARMAQLRSPQVVARPRDLRWVYRAAAAVVLAIGGLCAVRVWMPEFDSHPGRDLARGPDFDGNGSVDVLDAFRVARGVAAHETRAEWDFNGDGRVDRADADELARRAVRIGS